MTLTHKTLAVAGFLLCGLVLPQASYAISGCTNANLMGIYNAQVTSASFMNVLGAINSTSSSTVTKTSLQGGFGNNTNSLSGAMPGLGRYFLDGNGNINGAAAGGSGYSVIGSYSVNDNCSATMSLNSGQTYYAVVAGQGSRVMFIESDANGGGATGELDLATSACLAGGPPRSFAFNFFGAQQVTPSSSGTGGTTGGTTGSTGASFQATSAVGTINLDGNGNFALTEWAFASGSVKPVTATGTYTFGMNCALNLSFNSSSGATTGSVGGGNFQGILASGAGGTLVMQTDSVPDIVIGQLVGQ